MNRRARLQERRHFTARHKIEYALRLNLYTEAPTDEITLEDFELWAIDRLRLLSEIENQMFRNKSYKEIETNMIPLVDKYMPLSTEISRAIKGDVLDDERRKDHYSHFILRLAFCRSTELRRRFVKAESVLFRIRFNTETAAGRQSFMDHLQLRWENVTEAEKKGVLTELMAVNGKACVNEPFFKVGFERVPDLVEGRRVFLRGGQAYVPSSQQLSLLLQEFSSRLEHDLEVTARALPRLEEDDRLLPILRHLSSGFTSPEFKSGNKVAGDICANDIDPLSKHFPLCMLHLHTTLRMEKQLKYFGRLQYGLFLKGIGMSIEEAMVFWRSSFTNVTEDVFDKDYRYGIRHSYGLEGGRRNYTPYSCQQILTNHPPGPGESHGCPYRHFSMDNLISRLNSIGITDSGSLRQIREAVDGKHYHVACTRVYELTHGNKSLPESITHPNMYFEQSYKEADVEMKG